MQQGTDAMLVRQCWKGVPVDPAAHERFEGTGAAWIQVSRTGRQEQVPGAALCDFMPIFYYCSCYKNFDCLDFPASRSYQGTLKLKAGSALRRTLRNLSSRTGLILEPELLP